LSLDNNKGEEMIKLFVDRDPAKVQPGWTHVSTASEAIQVLGSDEVKVISLDYDLGDEDTCGNGYDVLMWIEEQVNLADYEPPVIVVRTDNAGAKKRMQQAVLRIVQTFELQNANYGDDDDDEGGGPIQWQ
jgi:hypothetical protein